MKTPDVSLWTLHIHMNLPAPIQTHTPYTQEQQQHHQQQQQSKGSFPHLVDKTGTAECVYKKSMTNMCVKITIMTLQLNF